MIQRQLKLKLNKYQEALLNQWLWCLTGVYNWAVRKIELDAKNRMYYSQKDFQNLLANHSSKLEIPSHVIQGILSQIYSSWQKCFKKKARKPRLKSQRNKLTYIPFPDPIKAPIGNHVKLLGLGKVRFHKQDIPDAKIKCGRIIKKASGWYLCLVIDTEPNAIPITGNRQIGIDPGFMHLLTLSTGEKIQHSRELEASIKRLGQAQRGHNKKLASRIQEHIANQRKDRNHKLSRKLVSENALIVMSKDNLNALSKRFGKSIQSSGIGQLQQFISYKASHTDGREYKEVTSKYSTMTCSCCGALTGPRGWAGLKVRQWVCSACGAVHDRDVNSAIVTLIVGAGTALERGVMPHQKFPGSYYSGDVQMATKNKVKREIIIRKDGTIYVPWLGGPDFQTFLIDQCGLDVAFGKEKAKPIKLPNGKKFIPCG